MFGIEFANYITMVRQSFIPGWKRFSVWGKNQSGVLFWGEKAREVIRYPRGWAIFSGQDVLTITDNNI